MQALNAGDPPQDRAPSDGPDGGKALRICFVALKARPALCGTRAEGLLGGAEIQQVRLARALRDRGVDVCFVTFQQPGAPRQASIDGFEVFGAFPRDAGWPGVRFFHPRASGLLAAMRQADAQIYYQRCAGTETGLVALFAQWLGRRFIYSVASDSDCDPRLPTLNAWRERMLYRYGLRRADAVVAQNSYQQQRLREHWGIDAVLIRSCAPQFTEQTAATQHLPQQPPRLAWIGRLDPKKRPDWVVTMARLRPAWRFEIVGDANSRSGYARDVRAALASCPNVTLRGVVAYDQMPAVYREIDLLLCTSRWEGFPNTFLEAWSLGRPVASSVDPDDLIATHGLGVLGDSPEALVAAAEALLSDAQAYQRACLRCQDYVQQAHSPQAIADQYAALLAQVLQQGRGRRAQTRSADGQSEPAGRLASHSRCTLY